MSTTVLYPVGQSKVAPACAPTVGDHDWAHAQMRAAARKLCRSGDAGAHMRRPLFHLTAESSNVVMFVVAELEAPEDKHSSPAISAVTVYKCARDPSALEFSKLTTVDMHGYMTLTRGPHGHYVLANRTLFPMDIRVQVRDKITPTGRTVSVVPKIELGHDMVGLHHIELQLQGGLGVSAALKNGHGEIALFPLQMTPALSAERYLVAAKIRTFFGL